MTRDLRQSQQMSWKKCLWVSSRALGPHGSRSLRVSTRKHHFDGGSVRTGPRLPQTVTSCRGLQQSVGGGDTTGFSQQNLLQDRLVTDGEGRVSGGCWREPSAPQAAQTHLVLCPLRGQSPCPSLPAGRCYQIRPEVPGSSPGFCWFL